MHSNTEEMELYLLGRLTEDQTSAVARHVQECGSCEKLLSETQEFVQRMRELNREADGPGGQERRQKRRVPTDDAAKLRVLQPAVSEPEEVQILDTSRDGLRLRIGRALEPGALVQVRMKGLVVLAEVRHCGPEGASYCAGVAIQDVFPNG